MQPASPTPTCPGNKVKLPTQPDRRSLVRDCNSRSGTFLLVERSATSVGRNVRTPGMSPTTTITEDNMMERLLELLLAGALVAPQVGQASERALNNDGERQAVSKFPEELPLPPIPYLDTTPWMNFGSQSKG